jgi:hypothetical protein
VPDDTSPITDVADQPSLDLVRDAVSDEPLLPIERKLIASCLILGLVLLGVLLWVSRTYFPVGAAGVK